MSDQMYLSYMQDIIKPENEQKPMSVIYEKSYLGVMIQWYLNPDGHSGWDENLGVVRHPPENMADSYILAQIYKPPIKDIQYITNMIDKIDALLPNEEVLIACTRSQVFEPTAAAFKLPNKMLPISAAECALSCRAMMKMQSEIISSGEFSMEEIICALDNSSKICLMLGGEESFIHLYNMAASPETYNIHNNIHDGNSEDFKLVV